jgi:Tfp pilus assembly protein PilF
MHPAVRQLRPPSAGPAAARRTMRVAALVAVLAALLLAACSGGAPAGQPQGTLAPETRQAVDALIQQGRDQFAAGAYQQARAPLEQAVAADPQSTEARFLLGNVYYYLGQLEPAAKEFEAAVALDPNHGGAHLNLGVIYYLQSGPQPGARLDQAIAEFRRAAELEPDAPDAHYMLGAAYLIQATGGDETVEDQARLSEARTTFEAALRANSQHAPTFVGLGNVYLYMRDYGQAASLLEQATRLDPDLPEAWFALGKAYHAQGSTEQAIAAYQTFLALNPPNAADKLQEARRALAELQGK